MARKRKTNISEIEVTRKRHDLEQSKSTEKMKTDDTIVKQTFSSLLCPNECVCEQSLPNEILVKLFELVLDDASDTLLSIINLSLVCETWRQIIISTPLLWRRLDLSTADSGDSDVVNSVITLSDHKLFTAVRYLNLNGWKDRRAEQVLQTIANSSDNNLRHISLKSCVNLSESVFQTIASRCPYIESLDLSSFFYQRNTLFSKQVFRDFLQSCGNNLLTLNISENKLPHGCSCIDSIIEFCPNLRCLDISNLLGVHAPRVSISRLQNACPQLRVLRAANIQFMTSQSSKSLPGFPSLRELSIPTRNCLLLPIHQTSGHQSSVYHQLTKSSDKLVLLDIRGAPHLTVNEMVKIPSTSVQYLSISDCPRLQDDRLGHAFEVTNWNKSLVDIDLSLNKSESSVSSCLRVLYELGDDSQLRNIQLRDSAVCFSELKKLISLCRKLQSIDLQSCKGLPRGIKKLYTGSEFIRFRKEVAKGKYD